MKKAIAQNIVVGIATTYHGTSYCSSNQFTRQEVSAKVIISKSAMKRILLSFTCYSLVIFKDRIRRDRRRLRGSAGPSRTILYH